MSSYPNDWEVIKEDYFGDKEFRYRLSFKKRDSDKNSKVLYVIMMNPNKADIDSSDRTTTFLLNHFAKYEFSKMIILNVLPIRGTGKLNTVSKKEIEENLKIIGKEMDKARTVLLATGSMKKNPEMKKNFQDNYAKILSFMCTKELFVLRLTKEGYGYHPRNYTECECSLDQNNKYHCGFVPVKWVKGKKLEKK